MGPMTVSAIIAGMDRLKHKPTAHSEKPSDMDYIKAHISGGRYEGLQ